MSGPVVSQSALTPGWACDGRGCAEVVHDVPGRSTRESLERAGWLVRHTFGVVMWAWCPRCRRGRLNHIAPTATE